MKVAVSGASGFVGRHVVAELERRDLSPVLWVRPDSDVPATPARHEVVRIDMHAPPERVFDRLGRPDLLIHLAWGGLPNYGSLHHFEQELPAQYRVLKSLVEAGLASLTVAGTCFEYGMQSGPLREDMTPQPDNPYGLAKDMLRRQLGHLQRERPFALTWARLFYLHGEGQAPGALLPQLRRAVDAGEAVFPMSGGEQLRDYLGVEDAAARLVDLALTGHDAGGGDGSGHGVVNLCSGRPIAVRRLVEGWIERHRWAIRPDPGRYPYPAHEPMAFWGDDTKLRQCLPSA